MLDVASPVPIHHQLATLLRAEIAAGRYPPGVRLPTEHELCQRFAVSRTPVRKALRTLTDEGLVVRYRRRGSFVVDGGQPTDAVDVVHVGADDAARGRDLLWQRITRGDAPDGAVVPASWVAELLALGAITPVEIDPDPIEAVSVPDAVIAMWDRGDRSFAIPVSVDLYGLWVRRSALEAIGDRPPTVWSDLRALALSARDLDGEVSAPFVMPAGSRRSGADAVMSIWLMLAAAGVGFGGAGPLTVASSGASVLTFLRRMIDTGLMSPDVVRYSRTDVVDALLTGQAVAGIGRTRDIDDDRFVFTGFPGSGRTGAETATLADCRVGVIFRQSARAPAAAHHLATRRSAELRPNEPALLASAHAPPVTPHHHVFSRATADLMDDVLSGRSTVEVAAGRFAAVAEVLTG